MGNKNDLQLIGYAGNCQLNGCLALESPAELLDGTGPDSYSLDAETTM